MNIEIFITEDTPTLATYGVKYVFPEGEIFDLRASAVYRMSRQVVGNEVTALVDFVELMEAILDDLQSGDDHVLEEYTSKCGEWASDMLSQARKLQQVSEQVDLLDVTRSFCE